MRVRELPGRGHDVAPVVELLDGRLDPGPGLRRDPLGAFSTKETVAMETFARAATSRIVTMDASSFLRSTGALRLYPAAPFRQNA
ncbi:hypothetical protein GCM10020220_040490 [Nonomuraea rubra]